jgi:hypothetical protein
VDWPNPSHGREFAKAKANSFSHLGAAAIKVLAKQAAIQLVKCELQRQGLRVHSVAMRDIHIAADDYLRQHPELIPQAAERAQRLRLTEHKSRHLRNSKPRTNSGLLLNVSHAQNGSME